MRFLELMVIDDVSAHVRAIITLNTDIFDRRFLTNFDSVARDPLNCYREVRVVDIDCYSGTVDDVDAGLGIEQDRGVFFQRDSGHKHITCGV